MSQKIIFICSSLEPGRDGVGDYVRLLAVELNSRGYQCAALSLNDQYSEKEFNGIQRTDTEELLVLRIPSAWPSKKRYQLAKQWVSDFNPQFISLQYVGFGYNKYGLPVEMLAWLPAILRKAKVHIMFHELWCGMEADASKKQKILGLMQKGFIKLLVKLLKPLNVFTNVQPYGIALEQIGVAARVVPIFGNIRIDNTGSIEDFNSLVDKVKLNSLVDDAAKYLTVGFFGTIYPYTGLKDLLICAAKSAAEINKVLGIICIGHNRGQNITTITNDIENTVVWNTGMLNHDMINRVSDFVNLGAITSPVEGVNKSGSAIAWIERGIPILISAADDTYIEDVMKPLGIVQITHSKDIFEALETKKTMTRKSRLADVANAYINLL